MGKLVFILGLSLIALASCTESNVVPLEDGRDYYPLEVGRFLEYRLDSIIFDDSQGGNIQDTLSGFIREVITGKFEGLTGDTSYIIERSFRRDETDSWVVTNNFTESTDNSSAFRQEGNLTQVKMRFPLRDNTRWDPTTFIDPSTEVQVGTELIEMFTNWEGLVIALDSSENVGAFNFEKVLTSQQADDDNDIERRFVMEKYAAGIGLVLRVDSILDSRCKRLGELLPCLESDGNGNLVPQPWSKKAEKGYILRQEITNFK
jgi:hypothetical protein